MLEEPRRFLSVPCELYLPPSPVAIPTVLVTYTIESEDRKYSGTSVYFLSQDCLATPSPLNFDMNLGAAGYICESLAGNVFFF